MAAPERSTLTTRIRLARALLAGGCALALSGCGLASADAADEAPAFIGYGAMVEEPTSWSNRTKSDPWLHQLRLSRSTFGRAINQQVRVGMHGSGPMAERDITLETPVTVRMLNGMGRERAKRLMRGSLDILDQREGQIGAIAWATNRAQFEAAAIGGFAEDYGGAPIPRADRSLLTHVLREQALDLADNTFAWYQYDHSVIVLGPAVTRTLVKHVSTPGHVTEAEGAFAAYIVRHELEHAVTAAGGRPGESLRWLEEGTADVMARWPGETAATARSLGLPYPKRYDKVGYFTKRGGYPEWAASIHILLRAAGVDPRRRGDFAAASDLLQAPMVDDAPRELARAIASHQGLPATRVDGIERQLTRIGGNPNRARAFVRKLG